MPLAQGKPAEQSCFPHKAGTELVCTPHLKTGQYCQVPLYSHSPQPPLFNTKWSYLSIPYDPNACNSKIRVLNWAVIVSLLTY